MKLKCTCQPGCTVPDELISIGYTEQTIFNVTPGRVYDVYAICVWKKQLHYLLLNDETRRPDWFPAFCFEVVDGKLPNTWHFGYWGNDPSSDVTALWGYLELIADNGMHYDALAEREPKAMEIFNARRKEMESTA